MHPPCYRRWHKIRNLFRPAKRPANQTNGDGPLPDTARFLAAKDLVWVFRWEQMVSPDRNKVSIDLVCSNSGNARQRETENRAAARAWFGTQPATMCANDGATYRQTAAGTAAADAMERDGAPAD
jgi:hypothetical protein